MRILSDLNILNYLKPLKKDSIIQLQRVLADNLIDYSKDESLVPHRIVTETKYANHLFMASTGRNVGLKALTGSKEGYKGAVLIIDKHNGIPKGLLNATSLTPFRTALATSLSLVKAINDKDLGENETITAFGARLQAYWHIKLTLILYPGKFSTVNVCGRSTESGTKLANQLKSEYPSISFNALDTHNKTSLANAVKSSKILYGCTSSSTPVIFNNWVNHDSNKRIFIGLIGSYKPNMEEVDRDLINNYIGNNGKIITDSLDHVSHEAGEIIQNNVSKSKMINVSELWENESENENYVSNDNIVLTKCVGLSIMDICIGAEILKYSEDNNIGTLISKF